uniref:Insulin-like domain-containing protein n=1 Tax=Timema cristinae TaxID=61476 RepID=A0A7R9GP02_TIMCR|nr:unnamed protein product [Timema cristinae]
MSVAQQLLGSLVGPDQEMTLAYKIVRATQIMFACHRFVIPGIRCQSRNVLDSRYPILSTNSTFTVIVRHTILSTSPTSQVRVNEATLDDWPESPIIEEPPRFPFRTRSNSASFQPVESSRRSRRGIVDECCAKSCTLEVIQSYCGAR